jgi:hypothetical protein
MQSDWYRNLWGERFNLVDDQNQKTRYENDKTGYRISDTLAVVLVIAVIETSLMIRTT